MNDDHSLWEIRFLAWKFSSWKCRLDGLVTLLRLDTCTCLYVNEGRWGDTNMQGTDGDIISHGHLSISMTVLAFWRQPCADCWWIWFVLTTMTMFVPQNWACVWGIGIYVIDYHNIYIFFLSLYFILANLKFWKFKFKFLIASVIQNSSLMNNA